MASSFMEALRGGEKAARLTNESGEVRREDRFKPRGAEPMMADGGEVDDFEDEDVDEGLIVSAMDIMDCMGNGWDSPAPNDDDNKIQKATKTAARRAKAKILAQALKSFFDQLR
jgi:hypothetical protein